MEAVRTEENTTSGVAVAIVPENTAGADTSQGPNYRKGRAAKPLGSPQERLEILAQELLNARHAGLRITARSTERQGAKLILIAIWDAWQCQTCGWWNVGGDKCQNEKCQTNIDVPEPIATPSG